MRHRHVPGPHTARVGWKERSCGRTRKGENGWGSRVTPLNIDELTWQDLFLSFPWITFGLTHRLFTDIPQPEATPKDLS